MLRSFYLAQRAYHPVARALSTAPGNAGSGRGLGPEVGGGAVPKPGGPTTHTTTTTTTTSQILQMWKSPPTSVSSGGGGAAPLGGSSSGGSGGIPGAAAAAAGARPGSTLVASLANIRKEMERNRRMQAERRTQAEALQNERRALQERAKELRRGGPSVHHYTQQNQNHHQQQQGASAQGAAAGSTPPSEQQQQQQQQQRQQPSHQSRFSGGAGRSYRGSDGGSGGGSGSSAHSRLASGHGASTSSFSGLVVGEEGVVSASLERRRRRAAATAASNPKGAGGTGGPGSGSGAAGSGAAALRGLRLKRHQKVAFAEGQRTRAGRTITIREGMTIRELALGMRLKLMPLFQKLEAAGERQHRKASESVDADVAQLIAEELGMVVVRKEDPRRDRQRTPPPTPEALAASGAPFRAPVVAVLGHVDHGKTSLLDALRGATTASREAGGITQGIAAFSVAMRAKAVGTGNVRPPGGKVAKATTANSGGAGDGEEVGEEVGEEALAAATGMPGEAAPSATTAADTAGGTSTTTRGRVRGKAAKAAAAAALEREREAAAEATTAAAAGTPPPPPPSNVDVITFIDTPGHALFSAMRRHGAAVTDIVVLCVDGSAGVQPQTRECIDIITSSASPCIVAVTKCDVVDPEEAVARVAAGLLEEGFATEAYGGDVPLIPLSSRTGMGLEDLKAAIALQAEALNLRAWVGKAGAAEVVGTGNTKVPPGGLGKKGKKALPPSSSSSSSSTTPSPPRVLPEAIVLDSRLIPGQGQVVDVVVTQGVLRVGDFVIAGCEMGRVKALFTDAVGAQSLNARLGGGGGGGTTTTATTTTSATTGGNKKNSSGPFSSSATGEAFKLTPVPSVLPGTPVRVLGLRGVPPAGSDLLGVEDEPRGMAVLEGRARRAAAGEAMRVAAIDALVRRAEREEYARARDRKVAFSLAVSRERQRAALRKAGQPIPPRLAPAPWEGAILAEARAGGVVGVGASGRKERQQGGQQTSLALGFAAAAANADAAAAAAGSGEGGAASTAPPILAVPTASLLLRADSAGALAALTAAVERIRGATVGVVSPRVVNASVGDVTEKDVAYASEMGAHVVAYGGKIVPGGVGKLAEKKGVSLTQGEVIYRVLEGLCGVLGGYLPPVWEEEVTAVAEAKAVFPLNASSSSSSKAPPSAAAGCVVVEGTFLKSASLFRVVRGGEVLHEVKELTSLQHFKKKVESVKKGDECGMSFEGFADIAVGDKIQTVVVKRKAQKLEVDWS